MMRRLILCVVALSLAVPAAEADLLDTWQEVQENLAAGDTGAAQQSIQILQEQAEELEVWRMPSFAAALVSWAESNPGSAGEAMVRAAHQLDPENPSGYFLEARWHRDRGATMDAVSAYLKGWLALFRFEPTRRVVVGMLIMWFTLAAAITALMMMAVIALRYVRGLGHDAWVLGGAIFRPANAWVFTFVLLLLPLFAGLGPVWLLAYLFCASWIYLSVPLRVWAVLACIVMILVVPILSWVQGSLLQPQSLTARLSVMLDERQADYSTLRNVVDLEPQLADTYSFHLILGELFRMHGNPGLAKSHFQKAALADPSDVRATVFVANLALEEGDSQRAVQMLSTALDTDSRNAFVYHNLSLAYDLNRRFEEGDVARARARDFTGEESADRGLRGLDPRIRFPKLGADDVVRLGSDISVQEDVAGSEQLPTSAPARHFLEPLTLVFVVALVFGLVVLVIRVRAFQPGKECTKCGKMYRLESGLGESSVFCPQCVSVFHKRDVVSIEQQTTKLRGIRAWERLTMLGRRLGGLLFPGSPLLLGDRVVRGTVFGFLTWFLMTGALIWLPRFLPAIEPLATSKPLQIGMLVVAGLMVVRSATMSWEGR